MANKTKLSGVQKIAVFMLALGIDGSSKLLKQYFTEDEIERISFEITQMARITESMRKEVIEEFLELAEAQRYMLNGGVKYAKELLDKTVGAQRAKEILHRLVEVNKQIPFSSLRKVDPKRLVSLISDEHPQTIALILSYLEPTQASVVLSNMTDEMKVDVVKRLATMEKAAPEVVDEIDRILTRKVATISDIDYKETGGIDTLVNILNRVDRGTEKNILTELGHHNSALVEAIRQRLFVFEDITVLDDMSLRRVLREIEQKDLALALKGANEGLTKRIFGNLSQRVGEMLKEEIEYMGPVRLKEVEEAQQKIVQVIRKLEEAGEITISRGEEQDAILV